MGRPVHGACNECITLKMNTSDYAGHLCMYVCAWATSLAITAKQLSTSAWLLLLQKNHIPCTQCTLDRTIQHSLGIHKTQLYTTIINESSIHSLKIPVLDVWTQHQKE